MKYCLILFALILTTPAFGANPPFILGQSHLGEDRLGSCTGKLINNWRDHIEEIEQNLMGASESKIKVIMMPIQEYLLFMSHHAEKAHPHVSYVEFKDGSKAIWKTKNAMFEVYAFRAAYYMLGMRIVAPAVPGKLNGVDGAFIHLIPSLNLSVDEQRQFFTKIPAKSLSDYNVFHYLFGLNDRHFGNVTFDTDIVSLDHEAIQHLTQINLNGTSYVARAILKPELREKTDEFYGHPFPFDRVRYLSVTDPKISEGLIRNTNMTLEKWDFLAKPFRERGQMMPVIFWRNMFWTPTRANNLPPINLDVLSTATLIKIRAMNYEKVKEFFPDPYFTPLHRELILKRREFILQHSKTAHLID